MAGVLLFGSSCAHYADVQPVVVSATVIDEGDAYVPWTGEVTGPVLEPVDAYPYYPDEYVYEGDVYYFVTNEYFEGDTYVFIEGQRCVRRDARDPRNRGVPVAWSPGRQGPRRHGFGRASRVTQDFRREHEERERRQREARAQVERIEAERREEQRNREEDRKSVV